MALNATNGESNLRVKAPGEIDGDRAEFGEEGSGEGRRRGGRRGRRQWDRGEAAGGTTKVVGGGRGKVGLTVGAGTSKVGVLPLLGHGGKGREDAL